LKHSDEYYSSRNLSLNEIPSLKIHGFYFSQNNEYALLAYTLLPWSLRYNTKYAILKREDNTWGALFETNAWNTVVNFYDYEEDPYSIIDAIIIANHQEDTNGLDAYGEPCN
jgi:hypothetical protein